MSGDYTIPIPKGELTLPEPPMGHSWTVRNVIEATDTETVYSIVINLKNAHNTNVITLREEWDRKREDFISFVLSVSGLALIELRTYENFISLDWADDNPSLTDHTVESSQYSNVGKTSFSWKVDADKLVIPISEG